MKFKSKEIIRIFLISIAVVFFIFMTTILVSKQPVIDDKIITIDEERFLEDNTLELDCSVEILDSDGNLIDDSYEFLTTLDKAVEYAYGVYAFAGEKYIRTIECVEAEVQRPLCFLSVKDDIEKEWSIIVEKRHNLEDAKKIAKSINVVEPKGYFSFLCVYDKIDFVRVFDGEYYDVDDKTFNEVVTLI